MLELLPGEDVRDDGLHALVDLVLPLLERALGLVDEALLRRAVSVAPFSVRASVAGAAAASVASAPGFGGSLFAAARE